MRSDTPGWAQGGNLHFQLRFGNGYPLKAPECRLMGPLPHLNVKPAIGNDDGYFRYRVAVWDCTPSEDGWSAAYSVQSILLQLQVLLLDEDLLLLEEDPAELPEQLEIMQDLKCKGCGHEGESRLKRSFTFLSMFLGISYDLAGYACQSVCTTQPTIAPTLKGGMKNQPLLYAPLTVYLFRSQENPSGISHIHGPSRGLSHEKEARQEPSSPLLAPQGSPATGVFRRSGCILCN